ncbi:MAG TPA: hypothetical protein VFB03_03240 [Candidatus Saccharimonadales bacterium]|nr:hypothetical protein [Candidatus Saccharimonadales bacterium]
MKKFDQKGGVALVLSDIFLVIALIAAIAFGAWAFTQRQDYKNNVDKKIAIAVAKARADQNTKDNNDFAEKEKLPTKTYKGPDTFGSVTFSYPKTWSGYIDQSSSSDPIKALFYPDLVPANASQQGGSQYALRVDLVGQTYDQVIKTFDSSIKQGVVKATAYVPPQMTQVPNVQTGTRFDGAIEQKTQGSMVVIKVRDKTLKIYTEAPSFMDDFNNTVLKSLTFVP